MRRSPPKEAGDTRMASYLWKLSPYYRQVAGELVLGSICGILMNSMVVLPPILLGRAVDAVMAFDRGKAAVGDVVRAALVFVAGTLATQVPRLGKRWWLMTANGRIPANLRADLLRGVLAWPMARLHATSVGDLMTRIIGDVEVLGVGVREVIIETWDTVLFSISLAAAMFAYDAQLSMLCLIPAVFAMLLAQVVGRWVSGRTTVARKASSALTTALQEQLAGLRLLRLFGCGETAAARVQTLSSGQAAANVAVVRVREGLKPVYTTMMLSGIALIVGVGGSRVISGAMTVGAFVAYTEALSAVCQPWLSRPAARELDPERLRGVRAPRAAARSAARDRR